MRLVIIAAIGLGLAMLVSMCGESPTTPGPTYGITGSVLACICTPDDPANDSLSPYYAVQTGRPAWVEMTRLDADPPYSIAALTDLRSRFHLRGAAGTWEVTVATAHSYRNVVDTLELSSDTSVDYTVRYRFRDSDTIDVSFKYVLSGPGNLYDPESPSETEYIEILNDSVGGLLDPDGAQLRVDSLPLTNELYHSYAVPLKRQDAPYWTLTNELPYWIYRWGSRLPLGAFPENMFASIRAYPPCPEDIVIVDTTFLDTFRPPGP